MLTKIHFTDATYDKAKYRSAFFPIKSNQESNKLVSRRIKIHNKLIRLSYNYNTHTHTQINLIINSVYIPVRANSTICTDAENH